MCRELTCSKRPFNPLSQFSTPGVRVLHRRRKRLKEGGGEQPPVPTPMSYVTVFKLYLGGGFFSLLTATSMLIATFNIPL